MASRDPQDKRSFLIPFDLVIKVRERGVNLEQLQDMVRLSARCTHPEGNRRFEDYIFNVQGNRVTSITIGVERYETTVQLFDCKQCRDTGKVQVFNPCERCEGGGCNFCDRGLVRASIPCPQCELKRKLSFKGV